MRYVGDAAILGSLMLATIVGGLGFPVSHELMVERGRRRLIWTRHTVLTVRGFIPLILVGTLIIVVTEMDNLKTLGPLG